MTERMDDKPRNQQLRKRHMQVGKKTPDKNDRKVAKVEHGGFEQEKRYLQPDVRYTH